MREVSVRVPASTTNLGPGFDALGLALALYNRISLERTDGPTLVHVEGEGAGELETGAENLGVRAAARLACEIGAQLPPLRVTMRNAVPVSRGLGSSSTAIVGGLMAANELLGAGLHREELLRLAVEMEGHPDNVTPAMLGGFQVTSSTASGLIHLRIPVPAGLRVVVCIPDRAVSTERARAALPGDYSREDAVFNVGRVALLVAAMLTGRLEALRSAMEDRLHQPYRANLVPGFREAVAAALNAGAVGSCLSGSGSTMLALIREDGAPAGSVGDAMVAAVRAAGCEARWLALDVDEAGAVVDPAPA